MKLLSVRFKVPSRLALLERQQAFSLTELLIAIAVIGVAAGLLLPALSKARERARAVQCAHNMKQIGASVLLYTADYQSCPPPYFYKITGSNGYYRLTPKPQWSTEDVGRGASTSTFVCPSDRQPSVMYRKRQVNCLARLARFEPGKFTPPLWLSSPPPSGPSPTPPA